MFLILVAIVALVFGLVVLRSSNIYIRRQIVKAIGAQKALMLQKMIGAAAVLAAVGLIFLWATN